MSDFDQSTERLQGFMEEAKSLKSTLDQLSKMKNIDELSNKIPLIDYAQLNASLAYCLNSLSKMYADVNEVTLEDPRDFFPKGDEERIKDSFTKIQEVILTESEQKENPFMFNKNAAERIIKAQLQERYLKEEAPVGLSDLNHEDKENSSDDHENILRESKDLENQGILRESRELENQAVTNDKKENHKKHNKKAHKNVPTASGNIPSWRDELEKMLK